MITLGIDTSNYATSVAVVDNKNHRILFADKQFLPVEKGRIGIRQQQALFYHIKNLTNIFSGFVPADIGAVGVSVRPKDGEKSYMPCFLAGRMSAFSIGGAMGIPVVECSHQTGHLTSALFDLDKEEFFSSDLLMLHVSGGTTDILLARNGQAVQTLGSSLDLFAGQAVDRLGVKFGFSFPAGEKLSELASMCNENIRVKVSVKDTYCNLSGLENQCEKLLSGGKDKPYVAKYCLTYIAYTLVKMIENARSDVGQLPVVLAGGVMSSRIIRPIIEKNIDNCHFVSPALSSDNAVGVAVHAFRNINKEKNG